MSERKKVRLGEIAVSIVDGDRGKNYPKHNEFVKSGFCLFLSTTNVTRDGLRFGDFNQFITHEKDSKLHKGKLRRGDIVLTTRGTLGNVGYYSNDVPYDNVRINSGMVILRSNEELLASGFVYSYLRSADFMAQVQARRSGAAQPQLPIKDLGSLLIPLPPLAIQRRIAAILSDYDAAIANCRKQIVLLEEAAMRLYREWFAEGKGKKTRLGDVVDFDPPTKLVKGARNFSVPMSALQINSMVLDRSQFEITTGNSGSKFRNGDTLLARITPCLENGKTAFVFGVDEDGACGSTEFIVMRSKSVNPYVVYLLARTEQFRKVAIGSMSGADGRQRARREIIAEYETVVPEKRVIDTFGNLCDPMFKGIESLQNQIYALVEARDRLLPKLMSGEVAV